MAQPPETPTRVLVTGAGGTVGRVVANGLQTRYSLRGLDRVEMPEIDDVVIGDIADYDTVRRAVDGMDAIIHLAAVPGGKSPWESVLPSNIVGTRNVFEAARDADVRRIAFASRAGLLSAYPKSITRTIDMPPRPDSYYSVSKVFGESLGHMYATRCDMQVVCVRIGNFSPDRPEPEHPHQLGHGDCVRVFERAIVAPDVAFEIVFGVSASNWPLYDLDHGARAIGYEPQQYAHVPESEWET